jgi:glycine oxidase
MPFKEDVVIVGGGVAGCSIAYHLAKQGVPSLIIERDAIASQASGKAWGVISPSTNLVLYVEGDWVPKGTMRSCLILSDEGLRRFPQLARELKEEGGVDVGYGELPVIRPVFDESEEKYLKERVSELKGDGFEVNWIEADDVKARCPDIAPGVLGGTLWSGQQVEPYRYTLALAQAAEVKGASIKQGEAVGFRYQGSKVTSVTLATSEIEADVVVLAMGPWTAQAAAWLGKELPMRVTRDQCLVLEVPQWLPPWRITSGQGAGVAIVPKVDGKVILGHWEDDKVDFDDRPTEEFRLSVMEAAVATIPRLEEAKLIEHRAAVEAWHPISGQPMLGRLPGWDNVYLVTWLAGFGIQWSPAVGRIMTDLIVKGRSEDPIEAFNPARYVS